MFCLICGAELPPEAIFCPHCGRKISGDEPTKSNAGNAVKIFSFSDKTDCERDREEINAWLSPGGIRILSASFTVEPTLMIGVIAPNFRTVTVEWEPEPGAAPWQLGFMLDPRTGIGSGGKKISSALSRQFAQWQRQNPGREIAWRQDIPLSLGWTSAWCVLFFYR